ncbi:MAG: FHA domain-containing protein [Pirellulales bacterium]|nr:FHA domain-containing protein [Pirellulales bacterium]
MGAITIQVIDGADRGRVFEQLATPVTVGREEGNTIQLNDERVSRFHLKIQEDHEKFVLTDLESTNGTKVNGEDIQLRILRYGDMIAVGRSVLVFGSPRQIAGRLAALRGAPPEPRAADKDQPADGGLSLDFELNYSEQAADHVTLHAPQPPELPEHLSPGQAAQLSELLEYLHLRLRNLLGSVRTVEGAEQVTLEVRQWQSLLELQGRLAKYLREVADPERPE